MSAITITDETVNGWRLEEIAAVRSLGEPPQWRCALMRERDGAVVSYTSPAGVAQAFHGASTKAREADTGDKI